jgi:DNA polymerase (family 10)
MAREAGVLVMLGADAHNSSKFDNLPYTIEQARWGWLEAKDILNSRSLNELRSLLN